MISFEDSVNAHRDRIEIEALKSKLSDITNSFKSKEIKLNSTIDRLTRKVADLERKLNDATMEIRVLEDHRAKDLESRQKLVSDYEHKIENLQKLMHKNSYTLNENEGNSSLTSQSNRFKLTSMQDIKRDLSVYDGFGKKRIVQNNLLNNGKVSTLTGQKKNGVTIKANGMDSKTTGIHSKGMTSKLELSMKSHIKDVKRQSNDVKDITKDIKRQSNDVRDKPKDVETNMYNSKESKSGANKQIYQLNGKGNNCGYESKDLEPLERYPNHQSPNQRQSIYAEAYKRSDSPKETNHLNTKPGLKIGQSNSPHFEEKPSLLKKPSRITISNVETDHLKQTIDVQDRDDYHSSKEDLDRLESRLELDTCVEEYVYSKDGKHERKYRNGTKLSWLPNGTMKMYHPDNIIVIYYSNGDSKTTFPDERVMYWYNATKTQHTSFKDGYELFEFENGQVEKYFPDGIHLVEFPDGITKTVYPDKTVL
ncbi:hypothetical protein HDV02_004193 [Globomyces sp. JEL0801]|nr:hypothetical protein HDV02_004193 [Globomyces sp. JEL0801]